MTDNPAAQQYLRLMELEDIRFTEVQDAALDGVLRKGRDEIVRLLRSTMDAIGKLPDAGPACEARRRAKLTWLSKVLAELDPPQ
jgi:hypothetical protein